MAEATLLQKIFVTICAVTRSTDLAARWIGAAPFLPALFVLRYANMGGLDHELFAEQIRGARSFRDARWCDYWNDIAETHARCATDLLRSLAGAESSAVPDLTDPDTASEHLDGLASWISPAAELFATRHASSLARSTSGNGVPHPPSVRKRSALSVSRPKPDTFKAQATPSVHANAVVCGPLRTAALSSSTRKSLRFEEGSCAQQRR